VLLRASNDTIADSYGTTITVEALMRDWWEGYRQHRTVSLQHNLPSLRGIAGKPMVGVATRVDFTPQLEVELRVLDPETLRLLDGGQLSGGSLEFVALEQRAQVVGGVESRVYYRLAAEPELCGLSLVDEPGVPGSDVLSLRALPGNWQFAVVDPKALEATSPAGLEGLRWFDHHDPQSHLVDESKLASALAALRAGDFVVPPEASLSREEVARRAAEHLRRHTAIGIGMRGEPVKEVNVNKQQWLEARAKQLVAEGANEPEAITKAQAEYDKLSPDLRAKIEGSDKKEADFQIDINFDVNTAQPQARAAAPATPAKPAEAAVLEARSREIAREEMARVMADTAENPMAALAAGFEVRSRKPDLEGVLTEIMAAIVTPWMERRSHSSDEIQRAYNILARNGIDKRALTLEANGAVIYSDIARQFAIKPQPDIIARNHWPSVPMGGVKKRTFPRFDRAGISHSWNRVSNTAIAESDPTLDNFVVEVTQLNSKVTVPDEFQQFNDQGLSFVSSVLLPAMRAAAQYEEDRQFFLSTGIAPGPTTFNGLKTLATATVVAPSANGDAFTQDILTRMLRALPVNYRNDTSRLAFYLPVSIGDDYGDILAARQTPGGDAWLQRFANQPGPMPIGVHRGVPIYTVPHLPTNETQGTSTNAATLYLVHRDIPVIGDAVTLRIEPYRRENFVDVLQLQEFVGLGYQWPEAIVRRPGVLPKV
jgi:hypothetical protein